MAGQIRVGQLVWLTLVAFTATATTVAALEYGETCQLTPSPTPAPTPTTVTSTVAPPPAAGGSTRTLAPAPAPTTPTTSNTIPSNRNTTEPCNSEAWLQCDGKIQKCVCQEGMVLAKDRKSCVSKIGQPCQTSESDPTRPVRHCIEDNASCAIPDDANRTAICQCEQGFLPLPGNEACRRGPGANCTRTEDCNTNALLSCQNGRCLCDRQSFASWEQDWDPIQAKCLSVVGGECNERDDAFIKRPCIQNAVCNNRTTINTCECKNATFKETPDKRCLLNYDQPCSTNGDPDTQCHPYYECLPHNSTDVMKCGCNFNTTVFDSKFQICAILAGQKCGSGSGTRNGNAFCVERAVCSERYKECKCEPGFIQTKDGFCTGGYRADCNLEGDKCDAEMNLKCVGDDGDRKCECMQNYTYSSDSRKCVGTAGAKCSDNSDCYVRAECGGNATDTDRKCRCTLGWSPTPGPDSKCMVAYEKHCTAPNQCNPYDFLRCDDIVEKICKCENGTTMVYDPARGKCVSRPGSHCNCTTAMSDGTSRKLECVGNATCAKIESSADPTLGICNCAEGFSSDGGLCVKVTTNSSPSLRLRLVAVGTQQIWVVTLAVIVASAGFWHK